jgi:acyl-CoA thioesterase YciA
VREIAGAGAYSIENHALRRGVAVARALAEDPVPVMMETRLHSERIPELRTLAMPADTNPAGDIFGGWLLAQMDLAAGTFAAEAVRGRVATVGIEALSFKRPVLVGDLVSCYCELVRTGRTSLTVHVETWVRRFRRAGGEHDESEEILVTEAMVTFVALNPDGSKRALPPTLGQSSSKEKRA